MVLGHCEDGMTKQSFLVNCSKREIAHVGLVGALKDIYMKIIGLVGVMVILVGSFLLAGSVLAVGSVPALGNEDSRAIDGAVDEITAGFKEQLPVSDWTEIAGATPDDKVQLFIASIIVKALGIIGSISLIVFVYSGIMWMTSAGNESQLTKAQHGMVWAALGMFVIFLSYTIVQFIIKRMVF